jgi:hypothetical protein
VEGWHVERPLLSRGLGGVIRARGRNASGEVRSAAAVAGVVALLMSPSSHRIGGADLPPHRAGGAIARWPAGGFAAALVDLLPVCSEAPTARAVACRGRRTSSSAPCRLRGWHRSDRGAPTSAPTGWERFSVPEAMPLRATHQVRHDFRRQSDQRQAAAGVRGPPHQEQPPQRRTVRGAQESRPGTVAGAAVNGATGTPCLTLQIGRCDHLAPPHPVPDIDAAPSHHR